MTDATCRGCAATILWVKLRSGRWMICDPPLLTITLRDVPSWGATIRVLISPGGHFLRGEQIPDGEPGRRVDGYVPHWATCPERERFKAFTTRKERA